MNTNCCGNREEKVYVVQARRIFDVTESSGDAIPCSRHHSPFELVGCKIHHLMVTDSSSAIDLLTLEPFLANSVSWGLQNHKRMVSILQMRC